MSGEQMLNVSMTVNGSPQAIEVPSRKTLADTLREDLALTGTHLGCEHGVCGACTVLVDGEPARSCLMLAVQAEAASITTIEGMAPETEPGGVLHPVQQAMYEAMSFQCAFCAPGFLLTTAALLERNPDPTPEEIREEISGNLCRCTGYASILAGVETAVQLIANENRGGDDV